MNLKNKSALIVIDVQKYFINSSTRHISEKIAKFISKNKTRFDFILFTKFANSKSSNFRKFFGWYKCHSSPDIDLAPALLKFVNKSNKNVFVKNTFSAFKSKKLTVFLRKNKINVVYLCGTDSDACVLASAFDAFDLGFSVHVMKELCASCNGKNYDSLGKAVIKRNLEKRPA